MKYPWGRGHMPSLDGWRAFSILLVLGGHCINTYNFPAEWAPAFGWLFDGSFGVRCFFLISGFLITTLMLRETAGKGKLSLRGFYLRRAIRILPVYCAFLAVVAVLEWSTTFSNSRLQWIHLVTFTTNFSFASNWLTGHTWSLSCEEQFYLLWPVLYLFLTNDVARRRGVYLFVSTMVVCPIWRVAAYTEVIPDPGYSLPNYLDTLAVGCMLAYVHPWLGRNVGSLHARSITILSVFAVAIPYVLEHSQKFGILTIPMAYPFQAFGLAWFISLSVHYPTTGLFSMLNAKPVIWLGTLSYSIYIWQQLFCTDPSVFGWKTTWFQSFQLWIPASLVTACTSYYLLERPFLRVRRLLRKEPIRINN